MEQAAQLLPLAFGHAIEQQGFGAHGIAAQGFHQAASLFGDGNDALAVVIRGYGAADQPLGFQALGDAGNGGLGKMQILDQAAGGDLLILRLPQDIEQGIALAGGEMELLKLVIAQPDDGICQLDNVAGGLVL